MTFLDYARASFWIAAAWAALTLSFFLNDATTTAREVTGAATEVRSMVYSSRRQTDEILKEVNRMTITTHQVLEISKRAAEEQQKYWADSSKKFGALLDQTNNLVVAATRATEHIDTEAVASLKELQVSLKGVTSAMAKVEALAANPDNVETQANLRQATEELAGAIKAAHGSMDEVQAVATHYRKTLTKPAGFAKTLIELVFGPVWKAVLAARAGR